MRLLHLFTLASFASALHANYGRGRGKKKSPEPLRQSRVAAQDKFPDAQARMIRAKPQYKIFEKLTNDPSASTASAVNQFMTLSNQALNRDLAENQADPDNASCGFIWNTWWCWIEAAKESSPDKHDKLVEFVFLLRTQEQKDPKTGQSMTYDVHGDTYQLWKELPAFGIATHQEWNSWQPDGISQWNWSYENIRGWNFIAILAQVTAANPKDYSSTNPLTDLDFSCLSRASFILAFDTPNPKQSSIRAASYWAIYASSRILANIDHGVVWNKGRKDEILNTREDWDSWKASFTRLRKDCLARNCELIDRALEAMTKAENGRTLG